MAGIQFHLGVAVGLAVSALIALGAPFAVALIVHRRTGAPLKYFGFGAAVFFLSQIVFRFPWQLPLSALVQKRTGGRGALYLGFIAFSALTAGLFEEVGRWLGYRFLVKKERSWRVGAMYGAGHGGIESILLVGVTLAGSLVLYILLSRGFPLRISPDKLEIARRQFSTLTPAKALAGGLERLFAICIQIALSIVVLQAFLRRQSRWLAYAIGLHFVVDFAAVMTAMRGGPLLAEVLTAAFAAASLVLIVRLRDFLPSTQLQ